MALIVCTECGKKFSDKAVCCPECGCPTEVVTKASGSPTAIAKKLQSSQRAAASMLEEVKKAKSEADRAEKLFDSRERAIQIKASRNIDLFGGDATSRVIEIRTDARRACEDLYTTYQSLVTSLDGMCRSLLAHEPGGETIKAVVDLMRYLNDESKIEDNCSATFNGMSLGSVANSKYMPSISSKMIQKFWESQYASTPYAVEIEKKRKQDAAELRKRREEERKKEAERRRKVEEHQIKLSSEYKARMEQIEADCKSKVSAFRSLLNAELANRKSLVISEVANHIEMLKKQRFELEKALSTLGIFQIKEKKEAKQAIEIIDSKISKLSDSRVIAGEESKLRQKMETAI